MFSCYSILHLICIVTTSHQLERHKPSKTDECVDDMHIQILKTKGTSEDSGKERFMLQLCQGSNKVC